MDKTNKNLTEAEKELLAQRIKKEEQEKKKICSDDMILKFIFGIRIKTKAAEKGLTQNCIRRELRLPNTHTVESWYQGRSIPHGAQLLRLARLLDCSIDYLLGNDIQKNKEQEIAARYTGLSTDSVEFIHSDYAMNYLDRLLECKNEFHILLQSMEAADTSIASGIILHPEYWKHRTATDKIIDERNTFISLGSVTQQNRTREYSSAKYCISDAFQQLLNALLPFSMIDNEKAPSSPEDAQQ